MSYERLQSHFAIIDDLENTVDLLEWDGITYLPKGGRLARTEALATLKQILHERRTNPAIGDWIEAARDEGLDLWQSANVDRMRHGWLRDRAVDARLVRAEAVASSECEAEWRDARPQNDWKRVEGKLQRLLDCVRERAAAIGETLGLDPYDALLDQWDPGLTRARIVPLFERIREAVPPLIDAALERQPPAVSPKGHFSRERQEELSNELMRLLGFDTKRGRLDTSAHPMTTGHPDDTRFTTWFKDDFRSGLYATVHETGHALYQQGLPKEYRKQPVGRAAGLSVHESQSLLFEKLVGRSDPFLELIAPILQRTLLGNETDDPAWQPGNLAALVRRVARSRIRVEADELTYPLHVILRFELETDLIDGKLDAARLPEAWAAKMRESLGIDTSGDDRDGCMQDTHHFAGIFGYFPTYSVGAVMAAQLFEAAREDMPDMDDAVRAGEFDALVGWLRAHVHGRGSSMPGVSLVEEASGAPFGADAYLRHLSRRYACD